MTPSATKSAGLERVRYFARQLMTVEDMRAEQDYFLERLRRHNRLLHGWGIVCGLQVESAATEDKPWQVRICPGFALSAPGDEIYVSAPVLFDLARPRGSDDEDCVPHPCPPGSPAGSTTTTGPTINYLAIRYACRQARPIRLDHAQCGCSGNACENTRARDDFALALLDELPVPYDPDSLEKEKGFLSDLEVALDQSELNELRARPCAPNVAGPWVVLTTVDSDRSKPPAFPLNEILSINERRLLPRAQDLLGVKLSP